jgi:hypothetical protein
MAPTERTAMPLRRKPKLFSHSSLLLALACAPAALAATLNYGVDAGIGETDNINLVSSGKTSQTMAVADADFSLQEQRRLFEVNATGAFSYLDFLQGAYSPELIGRFDGLARYALIPERLIWVLQDDFGQAQIDPFAPVTPANRENINYLSTGPDLNLRLGGLVFMDVTARYARAEYQTSPFNSNRLSGGVALGRALSAGSSVSIQASTERVLFENTTLNTDFDRSSVYGHYEVLGSRTELKADLGATKVEAGGMSLTGPLAKLQVSRILSAAAKLTFSAGRDITDASTSFSGLQSGALGNIGTLGAIGTGSAGATGPSSPFGAAGSAGTIGTAPAAVTSTNYTITYASAGWEYVRNRTTFKLNGQWEKDAYDAEPALDLNRGTIQLSIERSLTRVLSAQLIGSLYRTDYANTHFTETDGLIGAVVTLRAGRNLEVKLRCDHTSRVAAGTGTDYTENRAFLTVGYRPPKAAAH